MTTDEKTMSELFGKRLRSARRAADITQEQLAARLGCCGPFVTHMEKGRRRPSGALAMKLQEELGIPCTRKAVEFWYEE